MPPWREVTSSEELGEEALYWIVANGTSWKYQIQRILYTYALSFTHHATRMQVYLPDAGNAEYHFFSCETNAKYVVNYWWIPAFAHFSAHLYVLKSKSSTKHAEMVAKQTSEEIGHLSNKWLNCKCMGASMSMHACNSCSRDRELRKSTTVRHSRAVHT